MFKGMFRNKNFSFTIFLQLRSAYNLIIPKISKNKNKSNETAKFLFSLREKKKRTKAC